MTSNHQPRHDILVIQAETLASELDDALKVLAGDHPAHQHVQDAFAEVGAMLRELGYQG